MTSKGKAWILVLVVLWTVGCAGRMAFNRGESAYRTKNWDQAVEEYLKAVQADPADPRYRVSLAKAMFEASNFHRELGDKFFDGQDWKLALLEYQRALEYNPENMRAKKGKADVIKKAAEEKIGKGEKTEIEKAKERASKIPLRQPALNLSLDTPVNLKFPQAEQSDIFKTFQEVSGINILFDEAFKSKKISIDFINLTFKEALDRVLLISGLFYKVIDERTILIIPDSPAKRKEYEELVLKTFYLSNASLDQIQNLLRTVADIRIIAVNPELDAILVRDNKQKIEIAERIIASQDKATAELIIDVEVLEVNRGRMREYGIELSQYQITQTLSPDQEGAAASSFVRGHMFYYLDSSDFLFSIPSVSYKLLENDSKSKIIAKPQLRVLNEQKVEIKLGDKVPIPMTSFVPIAMGGVNQQAITSFQLQEVGINLELTPRIHHNGEITLKLKFALTFITAAGTSTIPPTIGNRSIETIIRLKDNETGLLAGLLRDTERTVWKGVPALRKIPILNLLFGSTGEEVSQTDIILTLTPRIVRMPDISEEDLVPLWIGTEKDLGIKQAPAASPFDKAPDQADKGGNEAGENPDRGAAQPDSGSAKPERPKPVQREETRLSFDSPSSVVPKDTAFMKKIVVDAADNLASLLLSVEFDPEALQVQEIREGSFMGKDGVQTSFLQTFNNIKGQIHISLSREGFRQGATGSGELALIVFKPIAEKKSSIAISSASLRNSLMAEVPVRLQSAEVEVK